MFTRRTFCLSTLQATAALASSGVSVAMGASNGKECPQMAAMRKKAKNRRRRLVFNSDGNDVNVAGVKTAEDFLAVRYNHLLNTNVDSVFYCTGATTMFTHLAQVGETYGEFITDDMGEWNVYGRDSIEALKAAGHDVLHLSCDFCHKHGIEIMFSHRINDIHDCVGTWSESELSRWKREHPEYLMGKRGDYEKYGGDSPKAWWTALDFEQPEVLDYLFRIEEDVCRRYDIDGFEIDYFRSPLLFRPNLEFESATPAQCELLTEFQRRLRDMAYRVGNERGRPILVAVRTPMTQAKCLHVGIDLDQWLREDLIDVLVVGGGYVPFTQPNAESVKLGNRYGVPVYPSVNASGMRSGDWTKINYDTPECWRAVASNMWNDGADGVYLFNIFPEREKATALGNAAWGPTADVDPRFTEIGDRKKLATLDKVFVIDRWTIVEGDLAQGIVQDNVLPKMVDDDGTPMLTVLPVGDNLAGASAKGVLKDLEVVIGLDNFTEGDTVEIRLNGKLSATIGQVGEDGITTFAPNARHFRPGGNQLAFRATNRGPTADQPISVNRVELHVKYTS